MFVRRRSLHPGEGSCRMHGSTRESDGFNCRVPVFNCFGLNVLEWVGPFHSRLFGTVFYFREVGVRRRWRHRVVTTRLLRGYYRVGGRGVVLGVQTGDTSGRLRWGHSSIVRVSWVIKCKLLGVILDLFSSLDELRRRMSLTLILLGLRGEVSGDPVIALPRRLKPDGDGALDVRAEARTLRKRLRTEVFPPMAERQEPAMDGAPNLLCLARPAG
jgi:hypothetical protein